MSIKMTKKTKKTADAAAPRAGDQVAGDARPGVPDAPAVPGAVDRPAEWEGGAICALGPAGEECSVCRAESGDAVELSGPEAASPESTTVAGDLAPPAPGPDLDALRATVEREKAHIEALEAEASKRIAEAKKAYRDAISVYRAACKRAGKEIKDEVRGRSPNVSDRVQFDVSLDDDLVRVAIRGRPETAETYIAVDVRESVNKVAYAYTDKHVGPREVVGNKGGSLSNRLRALFPRE